MIGFSTVVGLLLATGASAAVTFNVNNTGDGVDINPGNGICSTTAMPPYICTLRAAVMEANRAATGATINLPAGTYQLFISASIADGEENGDLNLIAPPGYDPGPTTISGAGAAVSIIDARGIDRVLSVGAAPRQLTISGVSLINGASANGAGVFNAGVMFIAGDCTISNNSTSGDGGGIFNSGVLWASGVTFSSNHADGGSGGGIFSANVGSMLLGGATLSGNTARFGGGIGNNSSQFDATFSTFAGNSASQDGGSIYNAGTMTLAASTLDGNMALGSGGGVYNASTLKVDATTLSRNSAMSALYGGGGIYNFGSLVAINSTLAQNQAYRDGGGIQNEGTSSIYNLTIAYNEADADADSNGAGAGIYNDTGATFNVRKSVVAENYLAGVQSYDDCTGSIGMYGNNKFSPTVNCTVAAGSPGTAAPLDSLYELGILRDNGGPTRTIALVPPSAMIDGALGCSDQNNVMLTNDQRGRQRYVGLNCDIGAFEYDADDIFASGFQ